MILRVEAVLVRELTDYSDCDGDMGFFEITSLADNSVNCVTLSPESTTVARITPRGKVLYWVVDTHDSGLVTPARLKYTTNALTTRPH